MPGLFEPTRPDGRSDRQVIYDAVSDAGPEAIFPYEYLITVLSEGLAKPAQRSRAQAAVRAANALLLREHQRYLRCVRGTGYRMIRADEHLPVAIQKREQAHSQLAKGLTVLRHTRLEDLNDGQRSLHEGTMIAMSAVVQMIGASEKRHREQEEAIDKLTTRVSALEGTSVSKESG